MAGYLHKVYPVNQLFSQKTIGHHDDIDFCD